MRYVSIFTFMLIIAVSGCSRPAENTKAANTTSESTAKIEPAAVNTTSSQGCPDYFYFYNQEKMSLKMKPHFLIVGFQAGTSPETKNRILRQLPGFETVSNEQTTDVAPFLIVKLKGGTSCAQALPIMKQLQDMPEVLYANPVFNAPIALGPGTAWIGLTSEFLVNIKSPGQVTELKAFVAETKTKIVDELGETTYLIQATKTSRGNALEMANLFHDQPFAASAEPDFYVAAQTGGMQNK